MTQLPITIAGTSTQTMPPTSDGLPDRPEVSDPTSFDVPSPTVFELANGAQVWYVRRSELPLVSIRLVVAGGSSSDPQQHPGLAWLTDTMLFHGSGQRDAAQFAADTERLAIEMDISTSVVASVLYVDTHTDRLNDALSLLADAVLRPTLPQDELTRVRELQNGDILLGGSRPQTIASWVAAREYFGKDHPGRLPSIGTPWGIKDVTTADLEASWSNRFSPNRATFVVVGDVDEATLREALTSHFGLWSTHSAIEDLPIPEGIDDGPKCLVVEHPGATQTTIRVLFPGWAYSQDLQSAGRLATIAIGGTFTSRLNRLMREEKGYTYGASAHSSSGIDHGIVVASTSVNSASTKEALSDLVSIISQPEPFTDNELQKARQSHRTQTIESISSRASLATSLARLAIQELPPDHINLDLIEMGPVATDQLDDAWKHVSGLTNALFIIVGDLGSVQEPAQAIFGTRCHLIDKRFLPTIAAS